MSNQLTFNPIHFGFKWTDDWYSWDRDAAHREARRARDVKARALKVDGKRVKKFSTRDQLVSVGGIGSGHPHIENIVTVYGINVS